MILYVFIFNPFLTKSYFLFGGGAFFVCVVLWSVTIYCARHTKRGSLSHDSSCPRFQSFFEKWRICIFLLTFVVDCHDRWCWWDIMMFCWLPWHGGWGGLMTFVVDCHDRWCWWDIMMFCWLSWHGVGEVGGSMTFVDNSLLLNANLINDVRCWMQTNLMFFGVQIITFVVECKQNLMFFGVQIITFVCWMQTNLMFFGVQIITFVVECKQTWCSSGSQLKKLCCVLHVLRFYTVFL